MTYEMTFCGRVGQPLPAIEWCQRFAGLVEQSAEGTLTPAQDGALFAALLDAWFPPPPRRWFRRPTVSVREVVLALPPARGEAIPGSRESRARDANDLNQAGGRGKGGVLQIIGGLLNLNDPQQREEFEDAVNDLSRHGRITILPAPGR